MSEAVFLEIVSSWRAMAHQAPALEGESGIDVIIGGLGSGKSEVAAEKSLRWSIDIPTRKDGEPANGLILGPDLNEVTNTQFEKFCSHVRKLKVPYDAIVKNVVSGNDPRIELWNGVTIFGRSGTDPERLRAYEYEWMWQDETASQKQKALTLGISRQRSARAIRAIITTSPKPGWIWRLINGEDEAFNRARRAVPVRVFRWPSKINTTNEAAVLEAVAAFAEADEAGSSRQELDGLFVGTHEAPGTGPLDWTPAFCGRLTTPTSARAAVVGIDLGKTEDYCWATAMNASGVALQMDRFKASTVDVEAEKYWPYAAARLGDFVANWKAPLAVIDSARGGDTFASLLRDALARRGVKVKVIEYATDKHGKKTEAVESLGMAIPMGRVRVPSSWIATGGETTPVALVEELRLEFVKLEVTEVGGRRRYKNPPGGHDDGVVSLSLAWHGIADQPAKRNDYSGWRPSGGGSGSSPSAPAGTPTRFGGGSGGRFSGGGGSRFSGR